MIMKTTVFNLLLFVAFLNLGTYSYAQVGIGTTNPHASAMLEIQSNDKGVLIPRMNTLTREGISNPAAGLLVFDTVTNSFWYYNSGWVELVSEKTLIDIDGDTKVELERTTDADEINFTTGAVDRMKIGSDGEILMGTDLSDQSPDAPKTFVEIGTDGTIKLGNKGASTTPDSDTDQEQNYTKITADGSLSYVGNATRWEDLKVPVNSVKIKKTELDEARWDIFIGNLALLWFENGKEDDAVFTVQMPHGWKEGTAIKPHVHWTTGRGGDTTAPGNNRVEWNLEYTWATVGEVFNNTSTNTGSVVEAPNDGSILVKEHVITPLGAISGNGKTLSSMLVCRLYRSGTDSFGGDAGLLEIDFHYQVDSDGSNQEYTKE